MFLRKCVENAAIRARGALEAIFGHLGLPFPGVQNCRFDLRKWWVDSTPA